MHTFHKENKQHRILRNGSLLQIRPFSIRIENGLIFCFVALPCPFFMIHKNAKTLQRILQSNAAFP